MSTLESLKDPQKRQVTPDRTQRQEELRVTIEDKKQKKLEQGVRVIARPQSAGSEYDESDDDSRDDGEMELNPRNRRQARASMSNLQKMLPDASEVLERLSSGTQGLSDTEMVRVIAAFDRHAVDFEVHKDELAAILEFLGYTQVDKEVVKQISGGVTDYSTLEKGDFVRFVEAYAEQETKRFREIFDTFDEDGNQTLDQEELIQLLRSLGFTPLRKMVKEALALVDLDNTGVLTFDQMVLLLHVYRHSEGFTRDEVNHLTDIYRKEVSTLRESEIVNHEKGKKKQTNDNMPADKLASALLKFFGPSVADKAKQLEREVTTKFGDSGEGGAVPLLGLHFSETLLWARRLRDKEFQSYRDAFHAFDTDKSGSIDLDELVCAFQKLGYSLRKDNVKELIMEAHTRGECKECSANDMELDFDGFVHVMQILHESDGFCKKEMEEIRASFIKFDEDMSGEIDVVELSDLFHYMGHTTHLDDMHLLINKVDFNNNGVLDFREFLRLMRLHREEQLANIQAAFGSFMDDTGARPVVHPQDMREALDACCPPQEANADDAATMPTEDVDLDGFVMLVDKIREIRVSYLRRRAGFSDNEIKRFEKFFQSYDVKQTGLLEMQVVTRLLGELGVQVRSREEQEEMVKQIETAREAAAERGACEHAAPGSPVNFWVIVQMLRQIRKRDDRHTLNKTAKAAAHARFNTQEVEEFRDVFMHTYEKDRFFEEADQSAHLGEQEPEDDSDKRELTKTSLRRLLRSLGVNLDGNQRTELDTKIEQYGKNDRVDFADFLGLMRWMMDTNFGGISQAAKCQASKSDK
jgi:Ca2+-binding EF-hand superfamily protein